MTQTGEDAIITIADRDGTTTADVAKGAKVDKGEIGATGPQGPQDETGAIYSRARLCCPQLRYRSQNSAAVTISTPL